jgi:hypothetical protein
MLKIHKQLPNLVTLLSISANILNHLELERFFPRLETVTEETALVENSATILCYFPLRFIQTMKEGTVFCGHNVG